LQALVLPAPALLFTLKTQRVGCDFVKIKFQRTGDPVVRFFIFPATAATTCGDVCGGMTASILLTIVSIGSAAISAAVRYENPMAAARRTAAW